MNLKDIVGIYDDVFTESECKVLMYKLEEAIKNGTAYKGAHAGVGELKKSTDYDILSDDNNQMISNLVMEKFNSTLSNVYLENTLYVDDYNNHRLVNGHTYYPLLQIQKYNKNNGHYNTWHVEAENYPSSDRAFVFILYLNDVEEGGETGFLFKEDNDWFKVKPKTGRLIIHPAQFPFIHKGYMPKSSDKYILTTWLCWKDLSQEQNPLFNN